MTLQALDDAIRQLELEMADLKHMHRDLFAYANAWAERYDAILAATPGELREATVQRLHRIGIRWGVADGIRMTGQFPAIELPA